MRRPLKTVGKKIVRRMFGKKIDKNQWLNVGIPMVVLARCISSIGRLAEILARIGRLSPILILAYSRALPIVRYRTPNIG